MSLDERRGGGLDERLEELGKNLGAREAAHADALEAARTHAAQIHRVVTSAIARFHAATSRAGAPHLEIELGKPRLDDKHVRAIEFDLQRGRHRAIVTVKAKGEVTLVGPFRRGSSEGPCRSFPWDAQPEIDAALGDFLVLFCEEATTP